MKSGMLIACMLALLLIDRVPRLAGRVPALARFDRVIAQMHNGDLSAQDLHALVAGYYEGLRNDVPLGVIEKDDVRPVHGFLRYEIKPHVKRRYAAGMRITNSFGMPNPEYGYAKPQGTRRIALIGDSIALGPYGMDFEALLENQLNQTRLTPDIRQYQILNFAVYGYTVLQMMDVVLERAPRFHPDVYMIALTGLETQDSAGWRNHVAKLILNRMDLKYDFVRKVVDEAGVRPTDRRVDMVTKFGPWWIPVTREALERMKNRATADGAAMIIVLVPAPIDPDFTAGDFNKLRPATDGLGVPVLDLRDTFRGQDYRSLQVAPSNTNPDFHPNLRGHELIFEHLYAALQANPEAWRAVTGPASR
jgi:hypothetical protein